MTSQNAWLGQTMSRLLREAPENRLADFGQQPIYDGPLMGIVPAADPVFSAFRTAVDAAHFMPLDIFGAAAGISVDPSNVSVVSWAFPFTDAIRASNRAGSKPSRLYSLARNNGAALLQRLGMRIRDAIGAEGFAAVVPSARAEYRVFRSDAWVFSSTWSERHAAFAAGLGQFGLNGAVITKVGINVRFLSVVTNLPLECTGRPYDDHRAACARGEACFACASRCPVGAVSRGGLDKSKCYGMRNAVRDEFMETYLRELDMLPARLVTSRRDVEGYSLGCALCQCGVPCEGRLPGKDVVGDA